MQEKIRGEGRFGSRREGRVNSVLFAECIFHGVCKMLWGWGDCMTGFCNPHNLEINKINGGELNS